MIRALIVDDEALAREGIRVRLREESDFAVVGEAADGPGAVRAIRRLLPDVVFLDVQMPGFDGLQVVDRVGSEHLPVVIFVTAYDEYAIKAFEAQALDYLLKPISGQRFHTSIERARAALAREEALEVVHERLARLPLSHAQLRHGTGSGAPHDPHHVSRLLVKDGRRFLLIRTGDVDWIESAANYAEVHARGRAALIRMTMNALEQRLAPSQFARINRSTIVNVDRIKEIRASASHGDFDVVLEDQTLLRLSRGYRDRLLRDSI